MSIPRQTLYLLKPFTIFLLFVSEKSKKARRQRARRLRRHVISLGTMLTLGSLRGWPQEPPPRGPTVTLGIEVNLPDRAVFYIPVVGDGEMTGIVPFSKGRFAGIRIIPRMRADSVHIELSALTTAKQKLSEATCDEVRSWNSEDAGSYDLKENASLLLSGLAGLGLPVFEVKVVPVTGPPPGGFHHPYVSSLADCGCEYPNPPIHR